MSEYVLFDFRERVISKLRKPYSRKEYDRLRAKVKAGTHFKQFPCLQELLRAHRDDNWKKLNILRGYFFWFSYRRMHGAFLPWRDAECMAVRQESQLPLPKKVKLEEESEAPVVQHDLRKEHQSEEGASLPRRDESRMAVLQESPVPPRKKLKLGSPAPPRKNLKLESPVPPRKKLKVESPVPPRKKVTLESPVPPRKKMKVESPDPPRKKAKVESSVPPPKKVKSPHKKVKPESPVPQPKKVESPRKKVKPETSFPSKEMKLEIARILLARRLG